MPRILVGCLVVLALAGGGGCARQQAASETRLAILPFENLSAGTEPAWISLAAADVLTSQLDTSARRRAVRMGSVQEALAGNVSEILYGTYWVKDGRYHVIALLQKRETRKTEKSFSAEGPLLAPLLDSIAREIEPEARPYSTSDEDALRAYGMAVSATTAEAANAGFEEAVSRDARFGAAWVAWTWSAMRRGDRERALAVLARAETVSGELAASERAQLKLQTAMLRDDAGMRRTAMVEMAAVNPGDAGLARGTADALMQGRQYSEAAEWYKRAANLTPGDPNVWNLLGYAQAYGGDLEAANRSFQRYREMEPDSANPLDSQGDAYFYLGRFEDAEKSYMEAFGKDPAFGNGRPLFKAGFARLMMGDQAAADQHFHGYAERLKLAGDPLVPLRQAQWDYLQGRRREAVSNLQGLAADPNTPATARPFILSQLAFWSLLARDAGGAAQYAQRAREAAQSPAAAQLALTVSFLAEQAGAPEARAKAVFPHPGQETLRRLVTAYAHVIRDGYAEAVPPLDFLADRAAFGAAEPVDFLLGWALLEASDPERAGKYLLYNPIDQLVGEQIFTALVFPRIFELRARYYEWQGDRAAVEANTSLYRIFENPWPQQAGLASKAPVK